MPNAPETLTQPFLKSLIQRRKGGRLRVQNGCWENVGALKFKAEKTVELKKVRTRKEHRVREDKMLEVVGGEEGCQDEEKSDGKTPSEEETVETGVSSVLRLRERADETAWESRPATHERQDLRVMSRPQASPALGHLGLFMKEEELLQLIGGDERKY
ncbi:hypothetical protein NDU88_000778 [Pleurodeles waltl]|uniref:Uncharacterized protein n=1 Tax=Pleurodeles waltl TaxID=8319 RepID=A0AAV7Q1S1_PLEWA|nr:hypothetical protein NDU88_000778 [Pleurodeles waltl]